MELKSNTETTKHVMPCEKVKSVRSTWEDTDLGVEWSDPDTKGRGEM